jgi:hypothetical protein
VLFVPTSVPFSFHWNDGIAPPFVGDAVKITVDPAQIILLTASDEILTLAVKLDVTVTILSAETAVQPVPAFDVSLSVTVPVKFTGGVYVIDAGVAVCAVLLNVPPPETIDHAPVVALPPTLAPDNAKATGDAD